MFLCGSYSNLISVGRSGKHRITLWVKSQVRRMNTDCSIMYVFRKRTCTSYFHELLLFMRKNRKKIVRVEKATKRRKEHITCIKVQGCCLGESLLRMCWSS